MSLDRLIESRIRDAAEAGAFEGLPGAGRPLRFDPSEQLAGDNWMGYKILRDGDMLPSWLMLAREIELDAQRLDSTAARYNEWVALARHSGDWTGYAAMIARQRERFAVDATSLRRKQDRFNLDAPSIALERPAIWVERRLEQLDDDLREAGAPPDLFPWLDAAAG